MAFIASLVVKVQVLMVLMTTLCVVSFHYSVRQATPLNANSHSMHMAVTSIPKPIAKPSLDAPVVIIGGGPAGLLASCMLAKRGYSNIKVFDRLPDPSTFLSDEERLYMIGLNGRGQRAFTKMGLMDSIDKYTSPIYGRRDWDANTPIDKPKESTFTDKKYTTKCILRDQLTSCILDEVRLRYSNQVTVEYQVDCKDMQLIKSVNGADACQLSFQKMNDESSFTIDSSFVVGADGVKSKIREAMNRDSNGSVIKQYADTNVRVYRTINMHVPKGWRNDVNYSARTKNDINFDALPQKDGSYIGVLLFRPWDDRIKNITSGAEAKAFFHTYLPQFAPILRDEDFEKFAKKKDSRLPTFSYAKRIVAGNSLALVGDSVHCVKPYFGQGLNSAVEDVLYLEKALDDCNDNVPEAMTLYSKLRASDAKALVKMSHALDGGFVTFVLPLIIDSILHRKLPRIFSPNTIASLQDQDRSFTDIYRRKVVDRVMQVALFGTLAHAIAKLLVIAYRFTVKKMLLRM